MELSDSEKSTSTTSTAERPLHEKESADDPSERIAQAKPDLAKWYSGWEESHLATWCREPNPVYGAAEILARPLMNADDEIIPRELEKNKHVRPERVPDPRIWDTKEQARVELNQSDSTETPAVPADWTLDPPAVRALWASRLEKMKNMTEPQRQQALQDIAREALKVMYPGAVPSEN
ncbi:hypothetical protein QBC32DRAFT_223257 [Pseudoneurospora amorphoporcata]|uniref:Uncharacterized protein n=1 Tax=Pseudoneurospora amorphoporcata TaxID=241081 RepID=A0AAN6NQ81_9PEZI|nr:hypothetical protein QBC32DRAFT_223257 [Pseudoneurospora amorphoporcata]